MNTSYLHRARPIAFLAVALVSLTLVAGTAFASGSGSNSSAGPDSSVVNPIQVGGPGGPAKTVSAVIDGAVGGQLKWGRFTLLVPPHAWYGQATVTLVVPKPSVLACQLAIDPPAANGFSVPVVLSVNTPGAPSGVPLVMGWFDPSLGKWTPMRGSWHLAEQKRVVAPLYHFSSYGVFVGGRAGW